MKSTKEHPAENAAYAASELRGSGRVAGALIEDEEALKGLVTDLAAAAGALVREDGALEASVASLASVLTSRRSVPEGRGPTS